MDLYLYTHNQFGDHCICYGIIKEFSHSYDKIYLYTHSGDSHIKNVKRLYSSIKNVVVSDKIVLFNKRIECDSQWYKNTEKWYKNEFEILNDENLIFDRHWYNKCNIDFNKKWDNFYFERDTKKEKELYYDILGLKDNEKYIFLHEDSSRNFTINKTLIRNDLKIVNISNFLDISILDTLYVMEKSEELHLINSAFLTFFDLNQIHHENKFYHKYTRRCAVEQPGLKMNWNIIN